MGDVTTQGPGSSDDVLASFKRMASLGLLPDQNTPPSTPATPDIGPGPSFDQIEAQRQQFAQNPAVTPGATDPNEIQMAPDFATREIQMPKIDTQKLAAGPTKAEARQAEAANRSSELLNDPTQFSSEGKVVTGRNELARMQGGLAQTQMAAFQTDTAAQRYAQQQQAAKDTRLATFIDQTATEYADKSAAIDATARSRIASRQKQVDDLAKMHVDPSRAWSGGSGAIKGIMYVFGLLAASQTRNSGQNMNMLIQAADNMVNRDISTQKANIAQKETAVNEQDKLDTESGQLDLKGMQEWSVQRELRYKSLDRLLSAQIAQMGNPMAEKAGLLKAKAAIDGKIVEEQGKFQTQVQAEGEAEKTRAHTAYMARLNHQLKLEEMNHEADLKRQEKQSEQLDKLGEVGLTSNNNTGLIATDDSGKQLKDSNGKGIVIRARDKESATKAGQVMSDANELNSQYQIVLDELKHTTNKDLAEQNFSPRLKAAATQAARKLALLYNKGALTDKDVQGAGRIMAGVEPLAGEEGLTSSFLDVLKGKGDTVEGAKDVLKTHLASLSNNTMQQIMPYVNGEDASKYKLSFQPQQTTVESAKGTQTTNEDIAQAGGGTDVSGLQKASNRQPLSKDVADRLINQSGGGSNDAVTQSYVQQRDHNALPVLPTKEQKLVETARDNFAKSTPERIIDLAQAYRQQIEAKHMSDETRFQITMEARIALKDALEGQNEAIGKTMYDAKRFGLDSTAPTLTKVKDEMKQYQDDIGALMETDAYKEMRKRVGLVRDVGE